MTKLHDSRLVKKMTVAEADAIFLEIARCNAVIVREEALLKKKIADLTAACKEKISADLEKREQLERELTDYILSHPERFVKPRKHPVGQVGTYGVTTGPAYIRIFSEEDIIAFALENGYNDIIRTEHTPDKDGILRRIAAGEDVPGAKLIPAGDVVKMLFKKGYAEQLETIQ